MKYPSQVGKMPARVLARLLAGQRLTHLSFQHIAATYRLAGPIERLRNEYGWPIIGQERIVHTTDPTGREARYFVYLLQISDIQIAGRDGQEFSKRVFEWEAKRIEVREKRTEGNEATLTPYRQSNNNFLSRDHSNIYNAKGSNHGKD
ncbi:hypothetical protein [Simiduia aestuariiviva]|uniref:Uncharacterized protein n=1 Tax=Simiduia aestuariiviva TaxID=1510459 RepID=A0A839UVA2_9GAMM|nr:hypothetical protein [Simiduia aestuariiviva]MBB3169966.1 hypothetical protein [Simiduia aestuariiviva]